MPGMLLSHRAAGVGFALAAALALALAHGSESWAGLVPCALCLVERWPYRIVIVFGLAAAILPPSFARVALALLALTLLTAIAAATVHVGVEAGWWPSPLPQCAAPDFSGGTIAERLARMPERPSKPCDKPTYLIPFLPVSMAAMNLIFACVLTAVAARAALRKPLS